MTNMFFIDEDDKSIYLNGGGVPSIEDCKLIRSYLNNMIKRGNCWITAQNELAELRMYKEMTTHYPKVDKPSVVGEIYIANDIGHNYLKIGWSTNPENREVTLQAERPTIKIIKSFKNATIKQERQVHKLLLASRVRGEWFNVAIEEAEKAINQILNK